MSLFDMQVIQYIAHLFLHTLTSANILSYKIVCLKGKLFRIFILWPPLTVQVGKLHLGVTLFPPAGLAKSLPSRALLFGSSSVVSFGHNEWIINSTRGCDFLPPTAASGYFIFPILEKLPVQKTWNLNTYKITYVYLLK